jgi:hypothetical protein
MADIFFTVEVKVWRRYKTLFSESRVVSNFVKKSEPYHYTILFHKKDTEVTKY